MVKLNQKKTLSQPKQTEKNCETEPKKHIVTEDKKTEPKQTEEKYGETEPEQTEEKHGETEPKQTEEKDGETEPKQTRIT